MATHPSLTTKPGDMLRDQAAKVLETLYGFAKKEKRIDGKKVDVYFEYQEFGRLVRLYVEAKDYDRPLRRSDVVNIHSDYSGILDRNKPAALLIVTRNGLSTDADQFVNVEQAFLRHQTILEIEVSSVDLDAYLQALIQEFETSGLSSYYIEAGYSVRKNKDLDAESKDYLLNFDGRESVYRALMEWVQNETDFQPVALLGGYGSGKTSVAKKIAAELAAQSLNDFSVRRPILIKLGNIARYSAIDGILGGLFTSEIPVRNFNFQSFQKLNESGHFLIILDGFDEMKHSMSWADFRAQVQGLLRLNLKKSKILLLGRPSAFLSEDEERHILRGERRLDEDWVRLPNWPRFRELELSEFSPQQRTDFVTRYLAFNAGESYDKATAVSRAAVTNEIADADPRLFAKPVHTKILTDLATDLSFDLRKFDTARSRWILYHEFIRSLYGRELEKEVRREISEVERIEFLRRLAFWLWSEKATSISFSLDELPKQHFSKWETEGHAESSGIRRELLSGSILERKASDIYYFGHRSFAEFLVADQMKSHPPEPSDHAIYAQALTDGVRLFLSEALTPPDFNAWADTFWTARGDVKQTYLQFLIDGIGGLKRFKEYLPPSSPWAGFLEPFDDGISIDPESLKSLLDVMFEEDAISFSWHYLLIVSQPESVLRRACEGAGHYVDDLAGEIMPALLNSLFRKAIRKDRYFSIKSEDVGLRRLAQTGIIATETTDGLEFKLDGLKLAAACVRQLAEASLPWNGGGDFFQLESIEMASSISRRLDGNLVHSFSNFCRYAKSFSAMTEVNKLKRPTLSRKKR